MEEVIETKAGIQFKEMCEKLVAGELSAKDFAHQYLDLWDGEYDQISEWEYNTYLDDLIMSVSLYEPDPNVYEAEKEDGLLNDDALLADVKKYLEVYREAKNKSDFISHAQNGLFQ
ncbi:colicin immunity domain-containing protein [Synergistes jonesii]|uniref:Colicin D immunity protein domain-containing protein n=1 Tax=Synergistes jonesii TaxID=2754 RepID=A0A073IVH1_9BACT|nr:colicin immunity domain-containing protein [Synergistes jonesii]KEJ93560.1 hypothetical protein EH55_01950 [Synergistes jonesii]OFB61381.1 hypothetical protein JS72_10495 [Synergistes jonesii]OFB65341.1 hypothetical protein JS73_00610 [Synergistes jonesii]OFB68691.1 hypothetical protein JS79_00620 [Synergistes jonesii]OFB69357.1 hypothetical protein JS78_00615 [Synergistes jonesii]